jgi:polyisoprenoid-binding protein YceI
MRRHTKISFLNLKKKIIKSTDLARTLNALVGVFRFETDVGRRESLLVTVDVAVVQTGDARRRRTAAEIR